MAAEFTIEKMFPAAGAIVWIFGGVLLLVFLMGFSFLIGALRILMNTKILVTAFIVIGLVLIVKAKRGR